MPVRCGELRSALPDPVGRALPLQHVPAHAFYEAHVNWFEANDSLTKKPPP
jgi:hypothetical protein